MIVRSLSLEDFFISKIQNVPSREDTKAYIISTLTKYKNADKDLSHSILTVEFSKAKEQYSFEKYQDIGDWILFAKSIYPKSLQNASDDYYLSMAQMSYYRCHIILNRTWAVFEELSDSLPIIINYLQSEKIQDL